MDSLKIISSASNILGCSFFNKTFDILSNPLLVLLGKLEIILEISSLSQGVQNIHRTGFQIETSFEKFVFTPNSIRYR